MKERALKLKGLHLASMVLAWTCFVCFSGLAVSSWDGEVTLSFALNIVCAVLWLVTGVMWAVVASHD